METIKCVVVGDVSVGKTWLITTFVTNKNPVGYLPTLFDNWAKQMTYNENKYNLTLWDTAGQEEFEELRKLSFQDTDVFLLCYAVNNVSSFNNLPKWLDKLEAYDVPVLLVGTKCDIKDDDNIDEKMIEGLCLKFNLPQKIECSSLELINIHDVFETAVEMAIKPKASRKQYPNYFCCGCLKR